MFSLDNFYAILHEHLLRPVGYNGLYFFPFGQVDKSTACYTKINQIVNTDSSVIFYDQEPIIPQIMDPVMGMFNRVKILGNSEHSSEKQRYCNEYGWKDWYYFFHGFAALDWYRDFEYMPLVDHQPSNVFITFNNLVTKDRSYRLNLIAELMEHDLLKVGAVACRLGDQHGTWKQELIDPNSKLSVDAKKLIYRHFTTLDKNLIVDHEKIDGSFSAKFDIELQQSAVWHVVTETVFYHNKLHLTEKVFKPIVAKRPFMLLGAPGNLAYLKSYGFKTFDFWIDESYDNELNSELRVKKIVTELNKFKNLSTSNMTDLLQEMGSVTQWNFNHFYGEFRQLLIQEMLDNYRNCLYQLEINHDHINFKGVEKLLLK